MGPQLISLSFPLMLLWWIHVSTQLAAAQVIENGIFFTNALAVVDTPMPYDNHQTGSSMLIAIDVSGNGSLAQSARLPGSNLPTRFEGLQIFLISDYYEFNMTVSAGNTFLYQQSGSAVKSMWWTIPSCMASGSYNLTLYESSVINGEAYYTITPILILITGSSIDQCSGLNLFQYFQPSFPSPQSPWLNSQCSTCSTSTKGQTTVLPQESITITGTIENFLTLPDSSTGGEIEVITATLPWISADPGGTVTLTVGERTTEMTVGFVMTYTLTETFSGFTTTTTMTTSLTTEVEVPTNNITYIGNIPANAAKHLWMSAMATLTAGSLTMMTIVALLI